MHLIFFFFVVRPIPLLRLHVLTTQTQLGLKVHDCMTEHFQFKDNLGLAMG